MVEKNQEYIGKLFLIVGPSGSGKGTVIKELQNRFPGFMYPISYTTRDLRKGEIDGVVYHFISKEDFKRRIEADGFLEYAIVHSNNYYGTSKKDILDPLRAGAVVVREVDIQGFHSIQKLVPKDHLCSIFMKVKDETDLKGRILNRGEISDDELQIRLDSAKKEIEQADQCDYQVDNEWGKIKQCVNVVEKIILSEIKGLY